MAGIKRTPADAAFSNCVRERSNWTCERCGTKYEDGNTRGLDCSHFGGRASKATRYDPKNAFAHCRGCHQWLSSHPDQFVQHYDDVFGEGERYLLRRRRDSADIGRRAHREGPEIAKHYRGEFERMRTLRRDGVTGRLEFNDYFEEVDE